MDLIGCIKTISDRLAEKKSSRDEKRRTGKKPPSNSTRSATHDSHDPRLGNKLDTLA